MNLLNKNIWKMSHGKYISNEDHEWLMKNCYVSQGYLEGDKNGKNQGDYFAHLEQGDYFYLVRNRTILLLGQFETNFIEEVPKILESIPKWVMRKYKVIKDISANPYLSKKVNGRQDWKPQGSSTISKVSLASLPEFEEAILIPAFDIRLDSLGIYDFHHDGLVDVASVDGKQMHPLNQIIYGPPGTGKTFNTVELALSILENTSVQKVDYEFQKKRFDEFKADGRIEFITFHQSFSYEDFIEGLRAETENGQIRYEIKDGLFKQIAIRALFSKLDVANIKNVTFANLYSQFLASVKSNLPYVLTTKEDKKLLINGVSDQKTLYVSHADGKVNYSVGEKRLRKLYDAYHDFESFSNIVNITTAIRDVIGGCNATAFWSVLNEILMLKKKMIDELSSDENEFGEFEDWTYENIKTEVLDSAANFTRTGAPYVLIIDEINRGNMSRVFGELITLIEENKRFGSKESIEVRLPYSNELFKVPDNLYIIGTMNTTDRSLSMIDTALRRRFNFIEVMPNPTLLAGIIVRGVNLTNLLETINDRIEAMFDREHTIGHSFFINLTPNSPIESLEVIFKNNILPLLEEYFFEDWEKIIKVLGNSGIYSVKSFPNLGFEPIGKTYQRNFGLLKDPQTYINIYSASNNIAGNE